ncbi:MAG: RHS repeat-associated core domain-containing protein, partial [Planctomycetaceae bacterium]
SDLPCLPSGMSFTEQMTYDELGRQKLHITFEGAVVENVYGSDGRLSQELFFDNLAQYAEGAGTPTQTWTFTYDAYGRQVNVAKYVTATDTTTNESSTYDSQGHIASTTMGEGTVSYTYDVYGRLASTIVGTPANPDRVTYYTYDVLGRLKTVVEDQTPAITTDDTLNTAYGYTLQGNLDRVDLPNGTIEQYEYDSLNRLDKLTEYAPDSTPDDVSDNAKIAEYDYTVRADGQRTHVTETFWANGSASPTVVNEISWTYDGLNRLIEEDFDSTDNALDYTEHFTYDLASNRILDVRDLGRDGSIDATTASAYDANDRLLSEVKVTNSANLVTTYGYVVTQQTSKVVTEGVSTVSSTGFAYDLAGRMTLATVTQFTNGTASSIERTTYAYNSSGIRTSATTETDSNADGTAESTVRTEFLNDANNQTGYSQVLRESQFTAVNGVSTLTQTIDYTFGHTQISQTTKQYDANGSVTSYAVRVFGHDGHGSVRVLTDMLGALVQMYAFDAYGQMVGLWNAAGQLITGGNGQYADAKLAVTNLLYSGEQFDTRIGQQYLRERYYDASTGRFNSLDPFYGNKFDPLSFHKYLYTQGNPITGIDPSGLMSMAEVGAVLSNISFQVARLTITYASVIQRVTTIVVAAQLISLFTMVAEEFGFFPQTPINDIAFTISSFGLVPLFNMQAFGAMARDVMRPLRGTSTGGELLTGSIANQRVISGSNRPGFTQAGNPAYRDTAPYKPRSLVAEGQLARDGRGDEQ